MVADSPDLDANDHVEGDLDEHREDALDDRDDRDLGDGIEWPDGGTALESSPDADIIANARRRYGSGGA
ncbi:MAG: hypothetical protein ABIR32_23485, partial [Ilumatobacteraceae bacterium]